MELEVDDEMNPNRKLSIYKHIKKKAANDAQLLMNRIALIQKEEERARKKIQETKERAAEILALRQENEKRVQAYSNAVGEVKKVQQVLLAKNREQDTEGKKAREQRFQLLQSRRKEEVGEMVMEKRYLTQLMVQEQQREIEQKQKRREEVRRQEEEMKMRKEQERLERERKMKEFYAQKVAEEAAEAKRAEKLVKALEKKEREWIERLKSAQTVQDTAFEQLERALVTSNNAEVRQSMSRSSQLTYSTSGSPDSSTRNHQAAVPEPASAAAGLEPSLTMSQAVSQMTISSGKRSAASSNTAGSAAPSREKSAGRSRGRGPATNKSR
jgi:hypothetical protein